MCEITVDVARVCGTASLQASTHCLLRQKSQSKADGYELTAAALAFVPLIRLALHTHTNTEGFGMSLRSMGHQRQPKPDS